ncbi:ABC transporter substrate-binding protein [Diaphorobacter sp.]|uniref:ABC transporter substrate-binding protein n=1 Tax=Diaphorobacter sp. TaxID=1934310 RepID=UPI0028A6C883|nr:ABC transporter substrate-binding protein [Diaphorobacter sp.]
MYFESVSRRQWGLQAVALLSGAAVAAGAQESLGQTGSTRHANELVRIAVGGQGSLYYLPLTAAERLGYFRDEGLSVVIDDYAGGPLALDAVRQGRADIGCGAYESLLEQQALGFSATSVVLMGRTPQMALAASARLWPRKASSSYRDLRIGVSTIGASTQMFARLWLMQAGIAQDSVRFVAVGNGDEAMTALRQGRVHALSHVDPLITLLEQKNQVRILADTRSLKGSGDFFGGPMPGACVYVPQAFAQRHAGKVQRAVNAVVHALKWMQTAGPADLARIIPMQYWLNDRAAYLAAFDKVRETLSPDGLMPGEGPATALRALARLRESQIAPRVDLSQTYSNEWVRRAILKHQL